VSINHRAEALRLVEESHGVLRPNDEGACEADRILVEAQVHATLARDEEQAAQTADLREALHSLRRRFNDTRSLVAVHIAEGLASREKDRWKAAIELTKALDEAHCNVDDLVDARLSDDGWDPRSAYKTPASLVPSDDPWAATPNITADVPEPVRRVIAGHLAEMLLGNQSEDVHQWARGVAFELKRIGADLTPDIEKRIRELTLGRDPSDPPF
jgi:hypothetical protein